ncbi:hypothetical protein HOJ01_03730 [bacterium]|jgi:hypothetical protein|nr:hypothetical protein [bacterium]MBT6293891.1 hypothetical protein [bacterium]
MKNYLLNYLLFLNLSGRYAYQSDFSQSELDFFRTIKNIVFKDQILYLDTFTDLKMINTYSEDRLYCTLKRTLKILSFVPGVKQIAICNSFAFRTQHLNSDLDLFLILDHRFFYTTRFLMILLLTVFNLKRTSKKYINKVCLSFIISDKNLNLSRVRFQKDFYFKFWLDNLVFLGDNNQLKNKFLNVNHALEFNSNFFINLNKLPLSYKTLNFTTKFSFLLNLFEKFNKLYQLKRARVKYQILNKPSGIYIRDGFLKFHNKDIRVEFNKKFKKYLSSIFFD